MAHSSIVSMLESGIVLVASLLQSLLVILDRRCSWLWSVVVLALSIFVVALS